MFGNEGLRMKWADVLGDRRNEGFQAGRLQLAAQVVKIDVGRAGVKDGVQDALKLLVVIIPWMFGVIVVRDAGG